MVLDSDRKGAALSAAEAAPQQAELLASTLPPLLVEAERVAATVWQGIHGRRRVGSGETFWQFRQHQPGDPSNRIDWRQSAKSQRVFVRDTEWEAAQSVWLWRDASGSMNYRSSAQLPSKLERATLLLLATASLLVRGGQYVGVLERDRMPFTGRSALARLAETLCSGVRDKLPDGGVPARTPIPQYARLVLVSDFLSPLEDIDRIVRSYSAYATQGHLLQIMDPAEEQFPFTGRIEFHGFENEPRVLLDRAQSMRSSYHERLAAHRTGLVDVARASGWTFASHCTNKRPETPLMSLHGTLSHRAR